MGAIVCRPFLQFHRDLSPTCLLPQFQFRFGHLPYHPRPSALPSRLCGREPQRSLLYRVIPFRTRRTKRLTHANPCLQSVVKVRKRLASRQRVVAMTSPSLSHHPASISEVSVEAKPSALFPRCHKWFCKRSLSNDGFSQNRHVHV